MQHDESWPDMLARHELERYRLVLDALVTSGWSLSGAARLLETAPATLRRVVERYTDLHQRWRNLGPGRGRPRAAK